MQHSRLLQAFNRLEKRDIRNLSKFVRSPFFNQNEAVIRLFDYLEQCKFEWSVLPEKEKAFKAAYPNETYGDGKTRKCMSLLMRLLEQYLICSRFLEQDIQTNLSLATAYRHLDLPKHFSQTLNNLKRKQSERDIQNVEYHQDNYRIQLEEYEFTVKNKRIGDLHLQELADSIDVVYLASKLRQTCFSLSHLAVYNTKYELGLLPFVLEQARDYLHIPAISIYYYCYQAITNENSDAAFQAFKRQIFEHLHRFPLSEIRDLHLLALNFCIRRYNRGDQAYAVECFELYQEGLERNLLLEEGKLSRFTYNNIVSIALSIRKLDWLEAFIPAYKDKLEKQHQNSNYSFNMARLLHEKKDYDGALLLLQQSNYRDVLLNLSAKTTMLKIYYEIQAFDLLYSHLEALKTFIHRKKMMAYHRTNYLNIIRFTKALLELPPGDRQVRKQLKEKIAETSAVAEKQWLLKQFD
jgi:hypothetical protein